jgi:hypothetical protein
MEVCVCLQSSMKYAIVTLAYFGAVNYKKVSYFILNGVVQAILNLS